MVGDVTNSKPIKQRSDIVDVKSEESSILYSILSRMLSLIPHSRIQYLVLDGGL